MFGGMSKDCGSLCKERHEAIVVQQDLSELSNPGEAEGHDGRFEALFLKSSAR